MVSEVQNKCRILVVENSHDAARAGLPEELRALGHEVVTMCARDEAMAREDFEQFDLIVSDLDDRESSQVEIVEAFKLGVTSSRSRRVAAELHDIIEKTLSFRVRRAAAPEAPTHVREKIDLELPSDLTLMNAVLEYLLERVDRLGLVKTEQSNLFVALDEAFVNAVKHGNRNDPTKLLRVTAELSAHEAIFTVEDEGDGFDVREIPDPTDPANLFKSSGRGVLLIYNIMDEVEYSERGNRLKMVKRPETGTPIS